MTRVNASSETPALPRLDVGLPDFPALTLPQMRSAVLAAMADQRALWEEVATDTDAPTVATTLERLERARGPLRHAYWPLYTLANSAADDEIRALETELAPMMTEHRDALYLDKRIYARLVSLQENLPADVEEETRWLLHRYLEDFQRAGITLDDDDAVRLRAYNSEISRGETAFSQRAAAGMAAAAVSVTDDTLLEGLSEETVSGLRRSAADRGADGALVTFILPTAQPLVTQSPQRELRAQIHRSSVARGWGGDAATDTRELVLRLARLRAERAQLLGYPHHAAYVAAGGTARSTEAVSAMLTELAAPAARNAREEASELQAALAVDHPGESLQAWDWGYYADRVRAEKYQVDAAALRPYLELENVIRDGVFVAAERLYGLTFAERPDLPGYAEGVRVFEVTRADGTPGGLFVADYYAREGKRGGAWMHSLSEQSHLTGELPVVVNNLNITQPAAGEPTLLTWDEVNTAFHEFGHALHGLLSNVTYPSLSGTAVPRDFVEYPSQVNEMWATHPEILAGYARHHRTGEPLPSELLEALLGSQSDGEGFRTTEFLAAALLDQAWHSLAPDDVPTDVEDVLAFEERALAAAGVALAEVPPRYRTAYFNHAFGGGYDAGYYSYIWSEVLDADTVEWFGTEAARNGDGGLNREAGERFAEALLSRGHSRDPLASYRDLRGRDADIAPLLRRRKLTVGSAPDHPRTSKDQT
ncbi:M3 family metallopeptidase [Pseudactinotalea terrae]|uniref:M3 family metallopeptidase n=1 Tax=Pseudactinotalea terrae TaxID=1743262 RepID=UPI0012E2B589|nr:M3 family metallopeptidase [Pseudactinotalea terrae]